MNETNAHACATRAPEWTRQQTNGVLYDLDASLRRWRRTRLAGDPLPCDPATLVQHAAEKLTWLGVR